MGKIGMSEGINKEMVMHILRFRKVSNYYANAVTRAYRKDHAAAARDSDEQVATKVREWEISEGIEPRDWVKIGQEERRTALVQRYPLNGMDAAECNVAEYQHAVQVS
jgi:hypothetical protein